MVGGFGLGVEEEHLFHGPKAYPNLLTSSHLCVFGVSPIVRSKIRLSDSKTREHSVSKRYNLYGIGTAIERSTAELDQYKRVAAC